MGSLGILGTLGILLVATGLGACGECPTSLQERALSPQEATSCIAVLGKDPLTPQQAKAIWDVVLQAFNGCADSIPEDTLRLLGWVSVGIPTDHFANLSLAEIDVVASFGVFHNLSQEQLTALAEAVQFQWSSKEPEDLTHLDLQALGHILCGFNASDIARVHPDAYKEAAGSLSRLQCPAGADAVAALAKLALSADAFGDPSVWSPGTVRSVGCVLQGLPRDARARVPEDSLRALSPTCQPAD